MNDILKTLEKNKRTAFIVLAALMFVFFAFCPAVDIAGKATANGMKVIFDGKGLGFSRFLSVLVALAPLCGLVLQFVKISVTDKIRENVNLIWPALSFILIVLLGIALPDAIALAWGSYLYLVLAAAGMAFEYFSRNIGK